MIRKTLWALLAAVAVFLLSPPLAHACPGCAEAANSLLRRGFNNSILFLMAMPFTIAGSVALCIVIMRRRQQPQNTNVPLSTPEKEEEKT